MRENIIALASFTSLSSNPILEHDTIYAALTQNGWNTFNIKIVFSIDR